MKNKILTPILLLTLLTLQSCVIGILEDYIEEHFTEVTFNFEYEGKPAGTVVDTNRINQMRAVICEDVDGALSPVNTLTKSWSHATESGMQVLLNTSKTYQILFWADNEKNTAYHFKEDGLVAVEYTDYLNGGAEKMEEMYALYTTATITPESHSDSTVTVALKSPVSRLRLTSPSPVENSRVTFHSVPNYFDPFTDKIESSDEADDLDDLTFTFNGEGEKSTDGSYYISNNYIFAPAKDSITIPLTAGILKDGIEISAYEFRGENAVALQQGQSYEISIEKLAGESQWSIWNGKFPTASTLSTDPEDPKCYIIDNAEDIAWLSDASHTESLGSGLTFRVETDIDMAHKEGQKPLQLPQKSTFDGNGHTIKGFELTSGIFGEKAVNLNVRNLTIEDSKVENSESADVGMLANTLNGTSSFSNVSVRNSSISTDGTAGGMIGYISRKSKSSRAEKMDVVFENCHVYNTRIAGGIKEGCFVGLLRGYDNGETLTFKADCSAGPASGYIGLKSTYTEGNEGAWLADIDFSSFNSWLGGEECYRGIVMYGDNRYIPRWDGSTLVKPLLAKTAYDSTPEVEVVEASKNIMIYSAFDLAGAKSKIGASLTAMYFMENVDMFGAGEDGITYVPAEFAYSAAESSDDNYTDMFTYVDLLEGQGHSIYNMNMTSGDGTITNAAFIRSLRKNTDTIHRNLNFYNCNVISKAKTHINGSGNEEDLAAGAIVVCKSLATADLTYRMENIHVYDSRVFALQGMGILAAHLRGTMHNCSVNNCHLENYRCENHLEPFSQMVAIGNNEVTVSSGFYSYGEVGGLAGMIERGATITDSHVRGSTIYAWGQPDQEAIITGEGTLGKLAVSAAVNMGFYLVPGRHIGTLIGDIRTMSGEQITIDGCTVDQATVCLAEQNSHSEKVPFIGQAYYIQFMDTLGTVTVDGHTLTLADCNRNTVRD